MKQENKSKIKLEKSNDLNFLWGMCKHTKKSTDKIMEEIDENEIDN